MKPLTENWEYYRALVRAYDGVQKNRLAEGNRLRTVKNSEQLIANLVELMKDYESRIVKVSDEILRIEPIYVEFLSHIKGIGPTMAMRVLSFPWDLEKRITAWWAFAGAVPVVWKCQCEHGHKFLSPRNPVTNSVACPVLTNGDKCKGKLKKYEQAETKRYSGYYSFWNSNAKRFGFILTDCFRKSGGFYKEKYFEIKDRELKKGVTAGHAIMRAKRAVYKLFLSHLHQAGCEINDIPYTKPYQFAILEHEHFIDWKEVVSKGG